jgi:hypothetical protein
VVVASDVAFGALVAGQAVDLIVDVVADEATLALELNWERISRMHKSTSNWDTDEEQRQEWS